MMKMEEETVPDLATVGDGAMEPLQSVQVQEEEVEVQPVTPSRSNSRSCKDTISSREPTVKNLVRSRKICFSGRTETEIRAQLGQKYRWVRHVIGQGEKERIVWVKILNVEHMKRVIQMRKLMNTNYLNDNGVRDCKATGFGWYRQLQELKAKSTVHDKYTCLKAIRQARKRVAKNRNLTPSEKKPLLETKNLAAAGRAGLEITGAMTFPEPNDFSHPFNSEERRHAPFETPEEAGHKKNHFRFLVESKFEKMHLPSAGVPPRRRSRMETIKIQSSGNGNVQLSQSELIKEIKRMAVSDEAFEVLVNFKLAEMNPKKRDNRTSLFRVYCITLRKAIYSHDWALVTKSCEGLCPEVQKNKPSKSARGWSLWNGALLGLANIYKDDMSILIKSARMMRYALQAYPRRIGIDLATWLTQKGHFSQGVQELEAMHNSLPKMHKWMTEGYQNPKKSLIDFVAELFTAVNQYSIYKRNRRLAEQNDPGESEDDASQLFEIGKFVLTLFEILEKRGEEFECDSTILIEPLMDLTLALRGRDAARETLERICKKNYQHFVLHEFYLDFLQKYFPNDTQEIEQQKAKLAQFDFSVPPHEGKIRQAKFNRVLKRLPTVSSFKQIPNPSFSW